MKEKPTVGSPFVGSYFLTPSLRRRRILMYISLFTIAVPVNYTGDLWELFEAITYTDCTIKYVVTWDTLIS